MHESSEEYGRADKRRNKSCSRPSEDNVLFGIHGLNSGSQHLFAKENENHDIQTSPFDTKGSHIIFYMKPNKSSKTKKMISVLSYLPS